MPTVAARCGVRMREVEPRPWALGIRLRDEPEGARRYRVGSGAPAAERSVRDVHREYDVWISLVVREGRPLRVRPDTVLKAGEVLLVLADPGADPGGAFTTG